MPLAKMRGKSVRAPNTKWLPSAMTKIDFSMFWPPVMSGTWFPWTYWAEESIFNVNLMIYPFFPDPRWLPVISSGRSIFQNCRRTFILGSNESSA